MSFRIEERPPGAGILPSATGLAIVTALLGTGAGSWLGLGQDFALRAVAIFGLVAVFVGVLALKSAELDRFGAANQVTLLRVAVIALVAACIGEARTDALCWTIVVVVTIVLFIDGIDGHIARRTRSESAFGARFDMEADAALIMILSILCWQFDKAGAWVLAAGAMRYAFVVAAKLLPWMRRSLPASRRRQTVCIVQSGCMLGVISPLFPFPASAALAAATLLMLTASFAADVRWLWRARHVGHVAAPACGPRGRFEAAATATRQRARQSARH